MKMFCKFIYPTMIHTHERTTDARGTTDARSMPGPTLRTRDNEPRSCATKFANGDYATKTGKGTDGGAQPTPASCVQRIPCTFSIACSIVSKYSQRVSCDFSKSL